MPEGTVTMKYSVITFGCRVNQADSLGFEEDFLARGGSSRGARRRRRRGRQHVLGDRERGSGGAPDHSSSRAAESRRENRRHRLLRDPSAGRSRVSAQRRARGSKRRQTSICRRSLRAMSGFSRTSRPADRFGDGDGSCGAAIQPGVAGRTAFTLRVQTGCAEPCSYCIIPTTRGEPSQRAARTSVAGSRPRCRGRFQGDRADRRPSRIVWPRPRSAVVVD